MKYLKIFLTVAVVAFSQVFAFVPSQFTSTKLVNDARTQIGKTLRYDPAYTQLAYPMGDVPIEKGVCTDVVIRALRLQGIDLQSLIHQDMKANFSAYPKKWRLKRPDKNIDHRRVPNIATFLTRKGYAVKGASFEKREYKAGDVITWDLNGGMVHIGIVSDKKSRAGVPLIIHNIGAGTKEEDVLFRFKITGHYRLK